MTWKDYQNREFYRHKKQKNALRISLIALLFFLGALCTSWIGKGVFGYVKLIQSSSANVQTARAEKSAYQTVLQDFPFDTLEKGPQEVRVFRGGQDWTLQFTFDTKLQKFISDKLRRYKVDWAGVSVLDAKTGAVKALVSYSSKDPNIDHLSLRATFPAASIFKVVTASAAVQEKQFNANTVLTYGGDHRYIRRQSLVQDRGNKMTLGDAFAKSTNGIFGKVGARYLTKEVLFDYASAFGFNEPLPFEFPVQESKMHDYERSIVAEAKIAAGLGNVTLSPLHGALIAASVTNDGKMMKPYSLRRVLNERQSVSFEATPQVWKSPLTEESSRKMKKMMRLTVSKGTARRGFRNYRNDSVLSKLDIGGKTGSLTGKNPSGRNEWFVGYANDGDESLAYGIVIVSKKYWKIKPAELAKSLIRYHFKNSEKKQLQYSMSH